MRLDPTPAIADLIYTRDRLLPHGWDDRGTALAMRCLRFRRRVFQRPPAHHWVP
jgi:hypothetical protein